MSFALFVLLPAFLAFAGFVEWRKFGGGDRAQGKLRFRTSLALAGTLVLGCATAHSIAARLGWLDGSTVARLDAALQAPFLPGRFLMQRLVEPRYRLVCPICVENILEISLWLDVAAWSLAVHAGRVAWSFRRRGPPTRLTGFRSIPPSEVEGDRAHG